MKSGSISLSNGDMVKCELRVAKASCQLLIFCELRVTSCIYFASYALRVALIMLSCELNQRCELETQKCELKPKLRVACIHLKKGLFRQIKRYSKVTI